MAITQSIKGITDFWQSNQALISDIRAGVTSLADLAKQLDQQRKDGQSALAAVSATPFLVSTDPGTKVAQAALLQKIDDLNTQIQTAQADPIAAAALNNQLADAYTALANTYNSLVPQMITFKPSEVAQLQNLLQQAALDAAARQRQADVLNAAVQVSKFALGFAVKLTA